jgi:1-acyl-sn-glycerol-3-phosphate acyltransferase
MLASDKALHQDAPAQQAAAMTAEGATTLSNAPNAVLADLFTFHVKTKNFTVAAEQNALDMTKAFKLERLHGLIGWFFGVPARRITETIFQYDRLVGSEGLATGSAWLLEQFTRFVVVGAPPPAYGPLLIVANHPGLVDAMAICAQVPRNDLRILAAERPMLRLLPNVLTHLIFVKDDPQRRLSAIRAAASHLSTGGSLLTFPSGNIEPDPALHPDAANCLQSWSDSLDLLARLVPNLTIVPTVTSGVISTNALRHPLSRLYRTAKQREWVAATLQVMLPRYRDTQVTLRFGKPIHATARPTPLVIEQMRSLIAQSVCAHSRRPKSDSSPIAC